MATTSTGTVNIVNNVTPLIDPFQNVSTHIATKCVGTDCTANDAEAALTVTNGTTGTPKLLNVCSYPSQIPNSDPSDCVVTPNNPRLTLKKIVVNDNGGTAAASAWTLTADGPTDVSVTGSETGVTTSVLPGSYILDESGPSGYAESLDCTKSISGSTLVLATGDNVTCTFTNNDIQPKLTVTKTVTNNNGGTKEIADFPLYVGATQVTSGVQNGFDVGSYTVSETTQTGYTPSDWGGDCAADGSITLALGEVKACTITNDDNAAQLTVIKTVVNDNGGNKQVSDFPLKVTKGAVDTSVTSGTATAFNAGTYTVSETGQTGYAASGWGGDCLADGTVVLANGDSKTCTITNDDIAPTLTLVKTVTNDNGGTKAVADFALFIDGSAATSGTTYPVMANVEHAASETAVYGYSPSTWGGDCSASGTITLLPGENKTCTITNDDQQPWLKLVKTVENDFGGTATATDFQASVSGTDVAWDTFVGFDAGTYDADETGLYGYTPSDWTGGCAADGSVTLAVGDTRVCYITNSDVQPTLKLVKTVTNDDGGTKVVSDFPLFVDSTSVTSGVAVGFSAGTYTASETTQTGYAPSEWGGDCAADGSVSLAVGDAKTCTITNDDIAPKLTLVKTVTNDNGGTKQVADFPLFIGGVSATSGVAYDQTANVELTVSESSDPAYTASAWGGDCSADGKITLLPGDDKTCTITNNDDKADPAGTTEMSWVLHDSLTVTGLRTGAGDADEATVAFKLFSDATCTTQVGETETLTGVEDNDSYATVTGVSVDSPGTYYWQVVYSGDTFNDGFTTRCGYEVTEVGETITEPVE